MATPKGRTTAAPEIDFFSPDSAIWSRGGGFDLPEGDYILTEFSVVMFTRDATKTEARLGVRVDLVPRDNPESQIILASGEAHDGFIFYSMGSKAHLAFAPNESGTGIMPIPGGSGKLPDSSNWSVFAKSLADSGLPKGIVTNDVSVLAGTHVHMQSVPEPAERKGFATTQTGDAETQQKQYPRNIAVVTEIYDDGKPWEGTGGIPETNPVKGKGPVKIPPKAARKSEPEPEVEEEAEIDEDTMTAALGALAEVLEKNPKGTPKASLKLNAAKSVKKSHGDEMMTQVVSLCFENEEVLAQLVESLDFKLAGPMVKPK